MKISQVKSLWQPAGVYCNTATYGLPPQPAWEALQAALEDWHRGRTSWEHWGDATESSRAVFARLVGVDIDRVAVGSAVSELIGSVVTALPDGARVIVPEVEFTSTLFPLLVQRRLEVRTVPTDRFIDAIDDGVDAVAFSAVQMSTGEVADVDAIVAASAATGALTICDATQAIGWLPLEAGRLDAVACTAYKWLMSPRGTALLATTPELAERMVPLVAGWFAGEEPNDSYYGLPMLLAKDARRFDLSPGWFDWVGTATSLAVIESIGLAAVHAHDVALANRFREGLGLPPGHSAIVKLDGRPDAPERFARARIQAAVRAGSVRAAFHLYTTEADVDTALNALTEP